MNQNYSLDLNPYSPVIANDIQKILSVPIQWDKLKGKHIVITGASGMLAAYLVETLLGIADVKVTGLVRNKSKAEQRFIKYQGNSNLELRCADYSKPFTDLRPCNIIIHAASLPRPDTKIPVDVLEPNLLGTWHLLEYARNCPDFEQFLFFSSGAVYGDSLKHEDSVQEDQYFPVPFFDVKACYAEGKRAGENICISFMRQYGIPVKVLRYAHTYGPGMDLKHDPRSFVDFIRHVIEGRNIELLSAGDMTRHFCYISDATEALFRILLKGNPGEAYNIANDKNGITIRELAELLISFFPEKRLSVTHAQQNMLSGYAPQKDTFMPDISKIKSLGCNPAVSIEDGFLRTLKAYEL